MNNADKEAVRQHREQMRMYWLRTECTEEELAREFDVTQDLARIQILKAQKERDEVQKS
jgi:hypothetical protein